MLHIPLDVAIEIFLHCLPFEDFPIPRPSEAPLLLCHVCSLWRSIVQKTPILWSKIALEGPGGHRNKDTFIKKWESLHEKLSLWESNSKSTPLSLSLKIYYRAPHNQTTEDLEGHPKDILIHEFTENFLIRNSHRIRKLALTVNSSELLKTFFSGYGQDIQSMECLYLNVDWTARPPIHLRNAPSLQQIILDNFESDLPISVLSSIELPRRQLTHLIVHEKLPFPSFIQLLSDCPTLLRLSMWFEGDGIPSTTPITAVHLRALALTFNGIASPSAFDNLHFPSLETLRIYSDSLGVQGVLKFLPEAAPHIHLFSQLKNLRTLTLGYQIFDAEMLISLFRLTPLLREFNLDSAVQDYRKLFAALTYTSSQLPEDILLPKLEYLNIIFVGPPFHEKPPITEDLAVTMLLSRCSTFQLPGGDTRTLEPLVTLQEVDLWFATLNKDHAIIDPDSLSSKLSTLELGKLVIRVHEFEIDGNMDVWFSEEVPISF